MPVVDFPWRRSSHSIAREVVVEVMVERGCGLDVNHAIAGRQGSLLRAHR